MDVIDDLFAAYNAHDVDAVAACYRSDGRHEDVAAGQAKQSPAAIRDGLAYFLAAFPDARWTVAGQLGDAGRSVAWYTLDAVLRNDFGPFRAPGQRLSLRGVQVVTHDGGLIVRSSDYWDMATFRRQMTATS